MGNVDAIRYGGVIFRRYPDAKAQSDRRYYVPGIADRQRGVRRLHEEIWISSHGSIPDGCEIHHVDLDPLNNSVENLRCLTIAEHKRLHHEEREASGFYRTPERLALLERIQPLTKEWHASDEGREWHRRHAAEVWRNRGAREAACEQCGESYSTLALAGERFCSNNCKSAHRRASGVDDVDRVCLNCGGEFRANKYSKVKHCSRVCGQRYRARTKANGVQPDGAGGA